MDVVTRFAPSPTGLFHAGSYRTAIFSYLFARHHRGKFILRIEDTDRARSTKENEENILETLAWLQLEYDKFHRQSEWVAEHAKILHDFVDRNVAYLSREEGEDGVMRDIIRFRNPNRVVSFTDAIRGDITFDTTELKDFVIAKGFEEPLFHLVVVADDARQGVTHVIRGEDHISNTARQILIQEALDAPRPVYAHLPLVLGADRSKLSKRTGARPLLEYRALGYLPEAVLNYVALLGWHPGTDEEFFTKAELTERFTLDGVQKSGAIFDETKLTWFNRAYLLRLPPETFLSFAQTFLSEKTYRALLRAGLLEKLVPLMRERVSTGGELAAMDAAGEFHWCVIPPEYEAEGLLWAKNPDRAKTIERLRRTLALLELIPESDWHEQKLKEILWPYADAEGRGEVLWPLRYALSGREKSPDPFTIAGIIGKDETERRVAKAIERLS